MAQWTQAQLDELEKAIASGTSRVSYDGREVTYRNLTEMMHLRETIRRELGLAKTGRALVLSQYRKGTVGA